MTQNANPPPPEPDDYTPADTGPECSICGYPANAELGMLHPSKWGDAHLVCATSKASQEMQQGLEARLREAQKKAEDAEAAASKAKPAPLTPCEEARVKAIQAAELVEQAEEWRDKAGEILEEAQTGLEECQRKERERMEAAVRALRPPPAPLLQYSSRSKIKVGSIGGVSGIGMTLLILWVLGMFDPAPPPPEPVKETVTVKEPWPEPVIRFHLHKAASRKKLLAFLSANKGQLFPDQVAAFQESADSDNKILVYQVKADGTLVLLREERPNEP